MRIIDIYGEYSELRNSFQEFANLVTDKLFVAKGIDIDGISYAVNEDVDYQIFNLNIKNGN